MWPQDHLDSSCCQVCYSHQLRAEALDLVLLGFVNASRVQHLNVSQLCRHACPSYNCVIAGLHPCKAGNLQEWLLAARL